MTQLRTEPVISGQDYDVESVLAGLGTAGATADAAGRPPRALEDFRGEVSFVLSHGVHRHEVLGIGDVDGEIALVHEKMGEDGGGRDVRIWHVAPTATGFAARHVPPSV